MASGRDEHFSHALILATPGGGGIPSHKDKECVPGTALLAVGLEGSRKVTFTIPGRGDFPVLGDYLSLNGAHTEYLHSVQAPGYTLSVTWRTQKPQGHTITPAKTLKLKVP